MRDFLAAGLDLVYPRLCPGCDLALPPRTHICNACQDQLPRLVPPFCGICGEKFHGALDENFQCPVCAERLPAYDFARCAYHADDLVREMIHRFKYEKQMHLSPLLACLLLETLRDRRIAYESNWLLVPVPLHPSRLRERTFNQAEELCRLITRPSGFRWVNALRRRRLTVAQAGLDRQVRLHNLQGAFAMSRVPWRRRRVRGANILLVDDVLTTGSTGHECATVLKRDGRASKVVLITVARAGSPARG